MPVRVLINVSQTNSATSCPYSKSQCATAAGVVTANALASNTHVKRNEGQAADLETQVDDRAINFHKLHVAAVRHEVRSDLRISTA